MAFDSQPLVVIKLGGSLLTLPDLGARVAALLDQPPAIRPVFIAGGGAAADVVRSWGDIHSLSEAVCHDLAMESLNTTSELLATILPEADVVKSRAETEACWAQQRRPVIRLLDWMNESEALAAELPQTWDITSDSLAAWLAIRWQADELWLLKSVDFPARITVAEASREELIDRHFPRLAGDVPRILWCNLRANPTALTQLSTQSGHEP